VSDDRKGRKGLPAIDHADIIRTVQSSQGPRFFRVPRISSGNLVPGSKPLTGAFGVVFRWHLRDDQLVALKCFIEADDRRNQVVKRYAAIAEWLRNPETPKAVKRYFVGCELHVPGLTVIPRDSTVGVPCNVLEMGWVEGKNLCGHIADILKGPEQEKRLMQLANDFLEMIRVLQENGVDHGDLKPANIIIRKDGSIVLVDLDSMFIPAIRDLPLADGGSAGFQHKDRNQVKAYFPGIDCFPALVIYVSLVALSQRPDLWKKYNMSEVPGKDGRPKEEIDQNYLIFTETDLEVPADAPIFKDLTHLPLMGVGIEERRIDRVLIDWCGQRPTFIPISFRAHIDAIHESNHLVADVPIDGGVSSQIAAGRPSQRLFIHPPVRRRPLVRPKAAQPIKPIETCDSVHIPEKVIARAVVPVKVSRDFEGPRRYARAIAGLAAIFVACLAVFLIFLYQYKGIVSGLVDDDALASWAMKLQIVKSFIGSCMVSSAVGEGMIGGYAMFRGRDLDEQRRSSIGAISFGLFAGFIIIVVIGVIIFM